MKRNQKSNKEERALNINRVNFITHLFQSGAAPEKLEQLAIRPT
jgi:hypothetical protein